MNLRKGRHWLLCWSSECTYHCLNWGPVEENGIYKDNHDAIFWVRWNEPVKSVITLGPEDVNSA